MFGNRIHLHFIRLSEKKLNREKRLLEAIQLVIKHENITDENFKNKVQWVVSLKHYVKRQYEALYHEKFES